MNEFALDVQHFRVSTDIYWTFTGHVTAGAGSFQFSDQGIFHCTIQRKFTFGISVTTSIKSIPKQEVLTMAQVTGTNTLSSV